jgi:hypothetical protein
VLFFAGREATCDSEKKSPKHNFKKEVAHEKSLDRAQEVAIHRSCGYLDAKPGTVYDLESSACHQDFESDSAPRRDFPGERFFRPLLRNLPGDNPTPRRACFHSPPQTTVFAGIGQWPESGAVE